ncbi:putative helicase-primase primase subunit [Cyprinid herpesvirus 1]|uniref:Putative helicase-primase primase subunit n=1 Tax=Cyprinid herpesvirus 1 TaxID=317858 RepID=K7PBL0_9VIRU|nr:putative helicase-primase primase subunit [Cyprinid herpesvirus 1]AFJ20346.1 putative helicase-primase primase subunit [Cyprinid herpesvirus 1]
MSSLSFSQGRQPCTSAEDYDDMLLMEGADAAENPVCFLASDFSTHWTELAPSAVAALSRAFPNAAAACESNLVLRVFGFTGKRVPRVVATLPWAYLERPPSIFDKKELKIQSEEEVLDLWPPERYQAMTDMGPPAVSNFVKLRAEAVEHDMSWFASVDRDARKALLAPGMRVAPVWHNAIMLEYVRSATGAAEHMQPHALDSDRLSRAKDAVYGRHKYYTMNIPVTDVEDYEGFYTTSDKSPATPDACAAGTNTSPSSSTISPRKRPATDSNDDASTAKQSSITSYFDSGTRVLRTGDANKDDPTTRAKQRSIASYFGGDTRTQIKAAATNQSLQNVVSVFDSWVDEAHSAIQSVNQECYDTTPGHLVLHLVPSNSELKAKAEQNPEAQDLFTSGIDLLDSYVEGNKLMKVYAAGIPRKKRLVVFIKESPEDGKRTYVLSTPDGMDRLLRRATDIKSVVCWHEVFFSNRIFTRINFDIDAPWPGEFECDQDTYRKVSLTLQTLCYVVWSNTVGTKIQFRPLQLAIFRRPAKNKWSLRVILKLPFNCVIRNIETLASFVASIIREAQSRKLPLLTVVKHNENPDLCAHYELDTDNKMLLIQKASKFPKWFSKSTGQYVAEPVGWTGGSVVSTIDDNVYRAHKSVRLPWCGKVDGSKFLPVWTSPGTNAAQHWCLSKCLMSAPFTQDELVLLPELDRSIPFAASESSLMQGGVKRMQWGVPGAETLSKDRVSACHAAAERHYQMKFTEKVRDNFSLLISNKAVFNCDLCKRDHRNKQKVCFVVMPHVWFLKCFHDNMRVLYANLNPETGGLTWKEHTAVCQYGE